MRVAEDRRLSEADLSQYAIAEPTEPEPPRIIGRDVFDISAGVVDTDSSIPDDAVVTTIKKGRSRPSRWSRKNRVSKPEGRGEFLVKDVIASLGTRNDGFKVRREGGDQGVQEVTVFVVGQNSPVETSRGRDGAKVAYPTPLETHTEVHSSNRRRGRHPKHRG